MDTRFAPARSPEVYENLRKAFVESDQKPTIAELAAQFDIPVGTIYRHASEEQWNEMRVARLQRLESSLDAKEIVLQAASRVDLRVMRAFSDVVIVGLQKLTLALSRIPEDQASSTQSETINTASFAFKNFAEGCKSIGIVSFDRNLAQLGKEDNGRWNPGMLQQINVTVQNLQAQAEAMLSVPAPKAPVELD